MDNEIFNGQSALQTNSVFANLGMDDEMHPGLSDGTPSTPNDFENSSQTFGSRIVGHVLPDLQPTIQNANITLNTLNGLGPNLEQFIDSASGAAGAATKAATAVEELVHGITNFINGIPSLKSYVSKVIEAIGIFYEALIAWFKKIPELIPDIIIRILNLAGLPEELISKYAQKFRHISMDSPIETNQGERVAGTNADDGSQIGVLITSLVGACMLGHEPNASQIKKVTDKMRFVQMFNSLSGTVSESAFAILRMLPSVAQEWLVYVIPTKLWMRIFEPNSEYYNWINEVSSLRGEKIANAANFDTQLQDRIRRLHQTGEKLIQECVLVKTDDRSRNIVYNLLKDYFKMIDELYKIVDFSGQATSQRPVPFVIYLAGKPGIGKTWLSTAIPSLLSKMPKETPNLVYSRNIAMKHWDGYTGQWAVKIDDFGAINDSTGETTAQGELMTMVSNEIFSLPMASIEDKKRCLFRSHVVVVTSNQYYPRFNNITEPIALWRRRILYSVELKPGYLNPVTQRVDLTKVKDDFSHLVFKRMDPIANDINQYIAGPFTFEEFIADMQEQYEMHKRDQEITKRNTDQLINKVLRIGGTNAGRTGEYREHRVGLADHFERCMRHCEEDVPNQPCPAQVFLQQLEKGLESTTPSYVPLLQLGCGILGIATGILGWKYFGQKKEIKKQQVMLTKAESDMRVWRERYWKLKEMIADWQPIVDFGENPEDAWWNNADAQVKMKIIEAIVLLLKMENPKWSLGQIPLVKLWDLTPEDMRPGMLAGLKANVMALPVEERLKFAEKLFPPGHPAIVALTNGAYNGHRTVTTTRTKVQRAQYHNTGVIGRTNGGVDDNAYEIVQHKVIPASGILAIGHRSLRVLFIGGRWALFASHILSSPDEDVKNFAPEGTPMRVYVDGAYFTDLLSYDRVRVIGKDVVAYEFGKNFRTYKDIRHLFIKDSDLNGRSQFEGVNVMINNLGIPVISNLNVRLNEESVIIHHNLEQQYECKQAEVWEHEALPVGACGSPIISTEKIMARKIVGIHVANYSERCGFSVIITQEMLSEIEVGYNQSALMLPQDAVAETNSCRIIPKGNFSLIGQLQRPLYQPERTKLRPSILYNRVAEVKKGPAVLSSRDHRLEKPMSPLLYGIEKYGNVAVPIKEDDVSYVMKHIFTTFGKLKSSLRRVVTEHEAINGLPIEFADPMVLDTSPGYPYVTTMVREPGVKGKRNLFQGGPGNISIKDQDLKVRTELRWRMALVGKRIPSAWIDTLKDECRSLERVKAGKTRVFTIAPVDFTIVFRRLFLGFNVFVMENCLKSFSAVGINTQSLAWTQMYRSLVEKSETGIAGDYSGWDGNLSPIMMNTLCDFINQWYNDEEKYQVARRVMFDELIHTVHISINTVYVKHIGNPSGNPMTTILNTVLNAAYLRLVWLRNAPIEYSSLVFYDSMVRDFIYGDDNILAISSEAQGFFNPITINETMKEFGLTYTAADKKGQATFEKIIDLSFLKCGFRKDGPFVLPLLDNDTIENMVMWYRESDFETPMAMTVSNINESLRAKFFYGKNDFVIWRNKILDNLPVKYHDLILDWDYFYQFFFKHEFVSKTFDGIKQLTSEIERDRNGRHLTVLDKLDQMWRPITSDFRPIFTNGNTISNSTTIENYGKIDSATIPSNMTGDNIGSGNSVSGLPMDKPGRTMNAFPVYRSAFQNISQTTGSELINRLDLNPSNLNECIDEHFGADFDEMSMKFLLTRPTFWGFIPWQAANAPGTQIMTSYIGPMSQAFQGANAMSHNSPNPLPVTLGFNPVYERMLFDYVVSQFRFWTGSIRVRLDIVASQMHVGRLFFSVNYGIQPEEYNTFQQVTSQYGVIIDLNNEQRTFTFDIPFKSQTQWMETYHGGILDGTTTYDWNNQKPLDYRNYFLGTIRLVVLNSLVTTDAAPPDAEIIMSVSGGEDFEVYYPTQQNFTSQPLTFVNADRDVPPENLRVARTNGDAGTDAVAVPTIQDLEGSAAVDVIVSPEPIKTRPDFNHFGANAPIRHLGDIIKRYNAASYPAGEKRLSYQKPWNVSDAGQDNPYGFIRLSGTDGAPAPTPNNVYMAYVIQSVQPMDFFFQGSRPDKRVHLDYGMCPLAYFGSMYRFWRGSFRLKAIFGSTRLTGGQEVDVRRYGAVFLPHPTTQIGVAPVGKTRINFAAIAASVAASLEGTSLDPNATTNFGSIMVAQSSPLAGALAHDAAPYVDIEIPFTSRYNVLRTMAGINYGNEPIDHFSTGIVVFYSIFGTSGDTETVTNVQTNGITTDWNILKAAGDDFRFGCFIGPNLISANNYGLTNTSPPTAYPFFPDLWELQYAGTNQKKGDDFEVVDVVKPPTIGRIAKGVKKPEDDEEKPFKMDVETADALFGQFKPRQFARTNAESERPLRIAKTNADSKNVISAQGVISIGQRKVEDSEPGEGTELRTNRLTKGATLESEWKLSDMTKRRTYVLSGTWGVSNNRGAVLWEGVVPQSLLTAGLQTAPFERFLYWNGSLKVYIQVNGTRFHAGRLQAFYVPMTETIAVQNWQEVSYTAAQSCQCVFLDAATSNEAVLKIPYAHIYSYLNINLADNTPQMNFLGVIVLQVLSPLRAVASTAQNINYSIFVEFDDGQQFQIPRNTHDYTTFNRQHHGILNEAVRVANTNADKCQAESFDLFLNQQGNNDYGLAEARLRDQENWEDSDASYRRKQWMDDFCFKFTGNGCEDYYQLRQQMEKDENCSSISKIAMNALIRSLECFDAKDFIASENKFLFCMNTQKQKVKNNGRFHECISTHVMNLGDMKFTYEVWWKYIATNELEEFVNMDYVAIVDMLRILILDGYPECEMLQRALVLPECTLHRVQNLTKRIVRGIPPEKQVKETRVAQTNASNVDELSGLERLPATFKAFQQVVPPLFKRWKENPDFKAVSALNELQMKISDTTIHYVEGDHGQPHLKTFTACALCETLVPDFDQKEAEGIGGTKKAAREMAAGELLTKFNRIVGLTNAASSEQPVVATKDVLMNVLLKSDFADDLIYVTRSTIEKSVVRYQFEINEIAKKYGYHCNFTIVENKKTMFRILTFTIYNKNGSIHREKKIPFFSSATDTTNVATVKLFRFLVLSLIFDYYPDKIDPQTPIVPEGGPLREEPDDDEDAFLASIKK